MRLNLTNYTSILSCILLLFISELQAQNKQYATISGKAIDAEDQKGIYNTLIFIEDTNLKTRTTSDGNYKIEKVIPGKYKLRAFAFGYGILEKEVNLNVGENVIDLELKIVANYLEAVEVRDEAASEFGFTYLNEVEGTAIYAAKKTEVILLNDITANLATNNSRQVYARVAGLNIWENDGAGIQLGIGGRGLSPNRTSNFNTRQNGYDISADALGYPESYYTPPTQALERIEVVRGAASLQYGTQFGGMLNFKFKQGPTDKKFAFNSFQTVGSFGLFNSFNSLGGTVGKLNHYSFYQYKRSDGWRPNSGLEQHTAFTSLKYELSEKIKLGFEYTFMDYLAQQPGGLTDRFFEEDPRQSIRERNWFKVNWNLAAFTFDYQITDRTKINNRTFGLLASKDALGNLGRIDRVDGTGNRDLLADQFRNFGNETRLMHRYDFMQQPANFLIGARIYKGFTERQQGDANNLNTPDFFYLNLNDLEGSDFNFPSTNVSLFAENIFRFSEKFSITPGLRYEYINTAAEGYYKVRTFDLAGNILTDENIDENKENGRSFLLAGIGMSYRTNELFEIYGNISQNYRAINFNDIRVANANEVVDENIKDERGFNADLGIRGEWGNIFNFDVSLFHLSYRDRIGSILRSEPDPILVERTFRFRTNVSDARIYGLETYLEADLLKLFGNQEAQKRLAVFSNVALIKANYNGSNENGVEGNDVELVPTINLKSGINFKWHQFSAAYQFSYLSQQYSDATNAIFTPSAVEGVIPAYYVMDLSLNYNYKFMKFEAGSNNLTDNLYFTRRASGYPGPGIIPSDGRSFYVTVGVRL